MLTRLTFGGEMETKDRMTVSEAAKFLGYHTHHIYRLLAQGKLQGDKIVDRWLLKREDVEALKRLQSEKGRLPH